MLRLLLFFTLFFTIFTTFDTGISASPQLFFHYVLMLITFPILAYRHKIFPKFIIYFLAVNFTVGSYFVFTNNNTWTLLLKIIFIISFCLLYFYYALREFDFDVHAIFQLYLKGVSIICIAFFIQKVAFYFGIKPIYDLSYLGLRYNAPKDGDGFLPSAFLGEPSGLGIVLCPAVFVAQYQLITRKYNFISPLFSVIIILTVLLCSSATAYLGAMLCLILIGINYRKLGILLTSFGFVILSIFLLYQFVPRFKMRVDDSLGVFVFQNLKSEKQLKNGSTMSLFNNIQVAQKNVSLHPLFGTGLGSHARAFDQFNRFNIDTIWWAKLNREDASSMFIRLVSETGILGLLLAAYFLIKFHVSKKHSNDEYNWVISNALLVIIFVFLLRQGNYVAYGFPLFVLMYYFVFKINEKQKISSPNTYSD